MDGYYFKTRGHGSGAYQPRNIQEQVDAVMRRINGEAEPQGVPEDGIAQRYALAPQPLGWRDTADAIAAQLEREQAQRSADTGDGAGDDGWPMTEVGASGGATPSPAVPSYLDAAYDRLRQEAYLQASKIRDDLGRYYRDVTTDPLGALYSAAPSFGPYGAEAGQIAGAAGRAVNAFGSFLGRNKPYPLARAVGPAELADLEATGGAFRDHTGNGIKYFAETPEEAAHFARRAYRSGDDHYQGPYTIVETSIPRRYIEPDMYATVVDDIRARVIRPPRFPDLAPGVPLSYTPTPKRP